jgi:hypothetical protein
MASLTKPVIPCTLSIYVTNANTSKIMTSPLKPGTFYFPTYLIDKSVPNDLQERKAQTF